MSYKSTVVDGIHVTYDEDIPGEELKAYIDRAKKRYGNVLHGLDIQIDPDDEGYINLTYSTSKVPFQRMRRITGYLVGSLDRWNDAKRAEEKDRVKHDI